MIDFTRNLKLVYSARDPDVLSFETLCKAHSLDTWNIMELGKSIFEYFV